MPPDAYFSTEYYTQLFCIILFINKYMYVNLAPVVLLELKIR